MICGKEDTLSGGTCTTTNIGAGKSDGREATSRCSGSMDPAEPPITTAEWIEPFIP